MTGGDQEEPEAPKGSLLRLIQDVNANGLRVNNLFQLGDGWRANLWDGRAFYEFGDGATPTEALSAALARAEQTRFDAHSAPPRRSKPR